MYENLKIVMQRVENSVSMLSLHTIAECALEKRFARCLKQSCKPKLGMKQVQVHLTDVLTLIYTKQQNCKQVKIESICRQQNK